MHFLKKTTCFKKYMKYIISLLKDLTRGVRLYHLFEL